MSYAQVPGVSDRSGPGMGRLGNGLPVLGHVLEVVVVESDAAILFAIVEEGEVEIRRGLNAATVGEDAKYEKAVTVPMQSFMVYQSY